MASFEINLDSKPGLSKALQENPKLAKEVIGTFVALMEEAFDDSKGIRWADIAQQLHRDLTFGDLIRGILKGSLDLKNINPDAYDALKLEVHPLAMLSPRKNYIDGGMKISNWRGHFRLPEETIVSEETISKMFNRMLRYTKYVRIEDLAKAMEANQLVTFRGLGDKSVELLPMIPALRYQRAILGELQTGKFLDDIGAIDCGDILTDTEECPACSHDGLKTLGKYKICLTCNAGYEQKAL